MAFDWTALPPSILEPLLAGSVGKAHLARCALAALETGGAAAAMGPDLLALAWEHDPLDAELAAQALALDERLRRLPGPLKALLAMAAKTRGRLDAAHEAAQCAMDDANAEALARAAVLARPAFEAGADMLLARAHSLAGRMGRAAEACAALTALAPLTTIMDLHAYCALAGGDREAAMERLGESLRHRPWQVNSLLRLADLAAGADQAAELPRGEAVVLLYSWNKADDLDATLASLAASDTGGARIVALDNASTDDTPAVLDAWASRLGDRLARITTPTNLGAPAARNWLMARPEVRASRWVAYLDDDVLLPPDWLARLGAAARAFPEASAWGCKVVDAGAPARIQNADLHLRGGQDNPALTQLLGHEAPLAVTDLHLQTPDLGQFDYIRPCASVTGCCHLFNTERLLASGEFDIRFSPTQFDDLEHDLRMLADGGGAVYTGHLRVRHARRTGDATGTSTAAASNSLANMVKLCFKLGPDASALRSHAATRLAHDVTKRSKALGI